MSEQSTTLCSGLLLVFDIEYSAIYSLRYIQYDLLLELFPGWLHVIKFDIRNTEIPTGLLQLSDHEQVTLMLCL